MTWLYLIAAFVPISALAIWNTRRDYRRRGRLTVVGLGLLLMWYLIPHLALDLATDYALPATPVQFVGLAIAVLGGFLCVPAILAFRSMKKTFCLGHGKLTVSGPYRWSRNPQYVGWFLLLLGIAVMWWTWKCLIALVLLAFAIHALVLMEEEHLSRVFGDDYRAYCRRTRRYV